jgi:hypothetical protein
MKYLLIADVHLDNYADYNFSVGSRLKQFDLLSEEIVSIGKREGCSKLILAGDTLNRPTNRPKVVNALDRFCKRLSEGFTEVLYILGQHDIDTKSETITSEDTILSVFDSYNFRYVHKEQVKSGNITMGFQSWTPKQDTSWIYGELDYLIGHYTKSDLFGQPIDDSKFNVMLHGDIHNDQEIGKFISIGNPIQHDYKSQSQGTAIVLDDDTGDWKRIYIDENHEKFLRLYRTDDIHKVGFKGELSYYSFSPKKVKISEGVKVDIPEWENINELVEIIVKEEKFKKIHEEIKAKCVSYREIDFNFEIRYFSAKGFRSLVDFQCDFSIGDKIALIGENGCGKSSIIRALLNSFQNNKFIENEKNFTSSKILLEVGIWYQNKLYEITRGSTYGLKIDSIPQEYNNKGEFVEDVLEKLPFLRYSDLFFITSNITNLSDKFTPERRVELISKFYRLDKIDSYSETARLELDLLGGRLKEYDGEVSGKKEILKYIDEKLRVSDIYRDLNEIDLRGEIKKYNDLRTSRAEYEKATERITSLIELMKSKQEVVESLDNNLKIDIEFVRIEERRLKGIIEQLKSEKERTKREEESHKEFMRQITEVINRMTQQKSQLDSLKKKGICSSCGSKLMDDIITRIFEDEKRKYDSDKIKYDKLGKDLAPLIHRKEDGSIDKDYYQNYLKEAAVYIKQYEDEVEGHSTQILLYDNSKPTYDKLSREIETLAEELNSIKSSDKSIEILLPEDLKELELKASENLNGVLERQKSLGERAKVEEEIQGILKDRSLIESRYNVMEGYRKLTSRSGRIYKEILKNLAVSFSSQDITYDVESGEFRGKDYIHFNSFYEVRGTKVHYESLSDGQMTVCDLDFLSKLFSVNVGLLALDEHLKFLDEKNFMRAQDILNSIGTNLLLISTHDPNYTSYNRKFMLSLGDEGETVAIEC